MSYIKRIEHWHKTLVSLLNQEGIIGLKIVVEYKIIELDQPLSREENILYWVLERCEYGYQFPKEAYNQMMQIRLLLQNELERTEDYLDRLGV